jgi:hypothetical protein
MHKPLCLALAAALLGHIPFAGAENTRLRFNHVDVDPVVNPAARAGHFPTTHAGEGLQFVQFDAPIRPAWREALQARGLRVLQYYPGEVYLVWGRTADVAETARLPHVRWQGGLLAEDKINRDLAGRAGRIRNVDVHFYNNNDVKSTLATLAELGATIVADGPAQPDRAFHDAWIEVDAERLPEIARLPQVVAIAYAHPNIEYDDEMAAQIVAGNYDAGNVPQTGYAPWLASFGFDGSGVVWSVTDTGVDLGHPDLSAQIVGGFSFPGCGSPGGDDEAAGGHGTHVAGIVAGRAIGDGDGTVIDEDDPNGFRYGQGIAPGVSLYAVCSGNDSWPPAGGWQALSKANLDGGALGMNASWHSGEGTAHGYQASERTFDLMIRDGDFDTPGNQPFMVVFSAGNSGSGATTLTAPKEAKNPITTGSTQNFRAGAIDSVSTFSSRGPAVDGRVLPTIAAPGEIVISTRRRAGATQCGGSVANTDGHYSTCSGTSMAAPQASGAVAALAQWWRGYHGGADPSPAMAKALLVNGAVDIATANVPNNNEGWGRIHLSRSAAAPTQRYLVDQSVVLDGVGDTHAATLTVIDTARPVRVTLAWTDAAGAVGANPALVNNLDLEVTAGGTLYRGNVMTSGMSSTGGTADALNVVENVFLPTGTAGPLSLVVRATALPGDGIPGSGDATDQDFALVCDNCVIGQGYTLLGQPTTREICATSQATYTLSTGAVLGYTGTINFAPANVPAGASVAITPASVAPGQSAQVQFAPQTIAPGDYTFEVVATSASGPRTAAFDVIVTGGLGPTTLTAPANAATGVTAQPVLTWTPGANARQQFLEVATDAAFTQVVESRVLPGNVGTATVEELEHDTRYWWRVGAGNVCSATQTQAFSFTTMRGPEACTAPQVATTAFFADVEGDTSAWSTAGSTGVSTWAASTARPYAGTKSWLAIDHAAPSDQRLVSPPIALPAGQSPLTLSFRSQVNLEPRDATHCWDSGVLDISSNGGTTWTAVSPAQLLYDTYTGLQTGGPASGQSAWCGSRPYRKTVVDLASYAGQTINLRFRVTTDTSVGNEPHGWYVDDIRVQSCTDDDGIFADGFEATTP